MIDEPAHHGDNDDDVSIDLGPVVRAFEELRSEWRELSSSPQVRELLETAQTVVNRIRSLDAEEWEAIRLAFKAPQDTIRKADLLGRFGWTFPVHMSLWKLYQILALNDPEAVDRAFEEFYTETDSISYSRLTASLAVESAIGTLALVAEAMLRCL